MDEQTVLFDGIDSAVTDIYYTAVRTVLNRRKLNYFVVHHVEPDHCASITTILHEHPETRLVISAKGLTFLKQFYCDAHEEGIDFDAVWVVAEGDTLKTGRHELTFIAAPNVHWPEVIMTYDRTDRILFSADAFGSFKALDGHLFADQVNFRTGLPRRSPSVLHQHCRTPGHGRSESSEKAADLAIDMICPARPLLPHARTPEHPAGKI